MKGVIVWELAVAMLSLSSAASAWSFIAYDDASCQTNGREVNVPDALCIESFGKYNSIKPLTTYNDPSAQGRFCGACNWVGGCDVFWIDGKSTGGTQGLWDIGHCIAMRKTYGAVKMDWVS